MPVLARFAATMRVAIAASHGNRSSSVSGIPCAIFSTLAAGCTWSPSRNGTPRASASWAPTSVLPTPATPITQTSGFFFVTTELEAEPRQELRAEVSSSPRGEALVQRGREDRHRNARFDRRLDGPAAFARIRHVTGEAREIGLTGESARGEVEQPRGDHAAVSPHLGDGAEIQRILRVPQHIEAFGVGGHHPVLDAVVHHLHEMPGTPGAGGGVRGRGGRAFEPGNRAPPPRPRPRRSSGSSPARGRARRPR